MAKKALRQQCNALFQCSTVRAMLCTQLDIFREPLPDANPFQCTDADVHVLEVYASTISIVDRGLHKKDNSE